MLIAAAHQRRRHVWTMIHGGPESGLHKSTDAGKTWRRVRGIGAAGGRGGGGGQVDLGRIVIAFSPAQKGLIYAKVEASDNPVAIYASEDSTTTSVSWSPASDQTLFLCSTWTSSPLAA